MSPRAGGAPRSGHRVRQGARRHGSPFPFLRKGSREELRDATGATKLPALKLPDGTVITHSRAIFSWIGEQK